MTNRSWAAALLATACVADAVCGLHVATADGVSAILIVFSVVAVVGTGLAVSGWLSRAGCASYRAISASAFCSR